MSPPEPFEDLFNAGDSRLAADAFYALAEALPQPVWSFRAEGRCDFVNQRWLEFSGSTQNDIFGRDWNELLSTETVGIALTRWATAREQRTSFEVECRIRAKTGEYHWFLLKAVPLMDAGTIVRWFAILSEIDEKQNTRETGAPANNDVRSDVAQDDIEHQVAIRTQQLRETITQLEAFAHCLAHDMRAPCRALTNFSQLLLRDYSGHLPEEAHDYLERISKAAERLDAFIRDLLVYSRVAHDRIPLSKINVEHLLSDVIMSSPDLQPPHADVTTRSPLTPVMANDTLLSQCLVNLLTNACKFVREGETPTVHIFDEKQGDKVRIYVDDNGIGISEENRERIFNLFDRLNDDKNYSGTGVGLSIVRKAVERMNGKVGVTSNPDGGSRFWLELDAAPENA